MDPAERLEDEQPSIFNEILQAGHQEEIVHQHLENKYNPFK